MLLLLEPPWICLCYDTICCVVGSLVNFNCGLCVDDDGADEFCVVRLVLVIGYVMKGRL